MMSALQKSVQKWKLQGVVEPIAVCGVTETHRVKDN